MIVMSRRSNELVSLINYYFCFLQMLMNARMLAFVRITRSVQTPKGPTIAVARMVTVATVLIAQVKVVLER